MNFVAFLPKLFKWSERFGVVITLLAILFKMFHLQGAPQLLLIGLLTLSATYFLSAFTIVPLNENKKNNFTDLLTIILRKIIFVGLSVFCVGYLFVLLHLTGASEMLIIGLSTIILSMLISMALILMKRDRMRVLQSPLIRSLAMFILYVITPYLR